MRTLVVYADELDCKEFHKWLDQHSPGWSWFIPKIKGVASTISSGLQNDRTGLEWLISNQVSSRNYGLLSRYNGKFRIHYAVDDLKVAMLAKLTWGHMKLFRMGTSA